MTKPTSAGKKYMYAEIKDPPCLAKNADFGPPH